MRNKYGGPCYKCGERVEPGTGHFERVPGHGWRVQHALHQGRGAVTCAMVASTVSDFEHLEGMLEDRARES
jgi:hypothetical protein